MISTRKPNMRTKIKAPGAPKISKPMAASRQMTAMPGMDAMSPTGMKKGGRVKKAAGGMAKGKKPGIAIMIAFGKPKKGK